MSTSASPRVSIPSPSQKDAHRKCFNCQVLINRIACEKARAEKVMNKGSAGYSYIVINAGDKSNNPQRIIGLKWDFKAFPTCQKPKNKPENNKNLPRESV